MDQGVIDDDALRSLAQFRPFEGQARGMESVHGELVAAACRDHDEGFPSTQACCDFIRTRWKIQLEKEEVQAARERLEDLGQLKKNGGALVLSATARSELDEQRTRWERAEATAMEEWEAAVRKEFPLSLDEAAIHELKSQLRPWLDRIISRHGAEASLLLYPGHARSKELSKSIEQTDLSFLPDCGTKLNGLRPSAFRLLIRQPTAAQREFLGRLLNTGFYLTVLSLDPKASHLAKAAAKKTTLYLDTNFLYALLGVGDTTEATAAKRLMELCRDLGYSLRVTPWTLDELRTSIAKSRADVANVTQSRKAAQVMAEVSGEKGFAAAYWRDRRDQKVDPKTFFGKFEQFRLFLEEMGIKEHPEGCAEIDADLEAIRKYASPIEGMYGPGTKSRVVIEHDAKMRILIGRLRGYEQASNFSDVGYWFLTESTRLPVYARVPIEEKWRPRHPFCILSSTWAQIVRVQVPRTEDLNDMIVGLLASPYVGYKSPAQGDHLEAVERAVSRIDALKDVPASVAVAMVNDDAMSSKIAGEADPETVDRMVDECLTQKAKELESRIDQTAAQVVDAKQAKTEAEKQAKEAEERESTSVAERLQAEESADLAKKASR
jgi:hypothetical protein